MGNGKMKNRKLLLSSLIMFAIANIHSLSEQLAQVSADNYIKMAKADLENYPGLMDPDDIPVPPNDYPPAPNPDDAPLPPDQYPPIPDNYPPLPNPDDAPPPPNPDDAPPVPDDYPPVPII